MVKRPSNLLTTFMVLGTLVTAGLVMLSAQKTRSAVPETTGHASEVLETDLSEDDSKVSILAPDGSMTLIVENKRSGEDTINQKFSIMSEDDQTVEIYSFDSLKDQLVSVPYNTFSPDNKFIFLKTITPSGNEYIVMRTDGKFILEESKTVAVIESFNQKFQNLVVTDVTGWGGKNLIVVNTDLKEQGVGPSFWFDVSNLSFIRLASRFN